MSHISTILKKMDIDTLSYLQKKICISNNNNIKYEKQNMTNEK